MTRPWFKKLPTADDVEEIAKLNREQAALQFARLRVELSLHEKPLFPWIAAIITASATMAGLASTVDMRLAIVVALVGIAGLAFFLVSAYIQGLKEATLRGRAALLELHLGDQFGTKLKA